MCFIWTDFNSLNSELQRNKQIQVTLGYRLQIKSEFENYKFLKI